MPGASFYRSLDQAIDSVAQEQAQARLQQQQAALSLLGSITQARVAQQMEEQQRKAAAERKSKAFAYVGKTMQDAVGAASPTDSAFDYKKRDAIGQIVSEFDPSTAGFGADDLQEAVKFWDEQSNDVLSAAATRQQIRASEASAAKTAAEQAAMPGEAEREWARVNIAKGGLALDHEELEQRKREYAEGLEERARQLDEGFLNDLEKLAVQHGYSIDIENLRNKGKLEVKKAGSAGTAKVISPTGVLRNEIVNDALSSNGWNDGLGEIMDLRDPQDPKGDDFPKYRDMVGKAYEAVMLEAKLGGGTLTDQERKDSEGRLKAIHEEMKSRAKHGDKGELDDYAVFETRLREFANGVPAETMLRAAYQLSGTQQDYLELKDDLERYLGGSFSSVAPPGVPTAPVTLGSPWVPPPDDPFK